ncbi:MAG TPA: lysylphosphatidylglycerol synthase transmembrane domain-containing protein [Nitrospira sp.]|nr:lysylphosphatidylglycerol synthase transmembrane domain-containing protein [Nitrospira sp.]
MLRYVLLALGLLTLSLLVWHIGLGNIYEAASGLGPGALLIVLIPSLSMYVIEAYGWNVALLPLAHEVPFSRLWAIRTAGEVVNMTTPTAYVGGEPLKAYLLQKHGVPIVKGLASVVIAKTTMTIAQVLFILVGIALAFWVLGAKGSSMHVVGAALLSVGILAFGMVGFVLVQRQGLFTWILALTRKTGWSVRFLESREEKLRALDFTILNFYTHHQRAFYASIGLYLAGWLTEAIEVFVIIHYLGGPADMLSALSIGALSVLIKGGTFFIPGSLGAQDAGNLVLLKAFGYSDVTGITFALLRRFRELVWIGVGLLCLMIVGRPDRIVQDIHDRTGSPESEKIHEDR